MDDETSIVKLMDYANKLLHVNDAFKYMNNDLFYGKLPELPVYFDDNVDFEGGFCPVSKFIVLRSDLLKLDYTRILNVLFHEMCHAFCDLVLQKKSIEIRDANQYHTEQFLKVALEHGGICTGIHPERGYDQVELKADFIIPIINKLDMLTKQ